jgi:hypothetical protein
MDHNTIANGTLTWSNSSDAFFGTPLTGTTSAGTVIAGGLTLNNNISSMNQQVRVAVFQVARNEDGAVASSKFIDEFWIERKPGKSIDFAVAKFLDKKYEAKYEADEIIIKEIYTVTL